MVYLLKMVIFHGYDGKFTETHCYHDARPFLAMRPCRHFELLTLLGALAGELN